MTDNIFIATVSAADMHAALKVVAKIVDRRNSIPILSNVVLRIAADGLELAAFDLDTEARTTIAADVPADLVGAALTVDAVAITAAVAKAGKGALVELAQYEARGRLSVITGRARSNIATLPIDDYPRLAPMPDDAASFAMPAAELARDLARLSPAMSTEETRYYLNGVEIAARDGVVTMTATNGHAVVTIARGMVAPLGLATGIMARGMVAQLVRMLGKAPTGDVVLSYDGTRYAVAYGASRTFGKAIDGTFPDVAAALAKAVGEGELQRLAFVEAEPRINPATLAKLGKPCGASFIVETGCDVARLTLADAPEYEAWAMMMREGCTAATGYEYARGAGADEYAKRYLVELAAARGFNVAQFFAPESNADAPRYYPLQIEAEHGSKRDRFNVVFGELATVRGATFGAMTAWARDVEIEIVDYETLTTRVEIVRMPDQYEDGAFSVAMPRERRFMAAAVTIGEGDAERPIRTNAKGEIELTAEQVRAMAADGPATPRVEIVPLPVYPGPRLKTKARAWSAQWYADIAADIAKRRAWAASLVAGNVVMIADAEPVAAVAGEPLESPDSVADAQPLVSVAEDVERADVAASPAPRRVCPVVPVPMSPFAVAAVDNGPDMAAMVAELLQRVAALEAERVKPAAVAGTSANYAAPGDDRRPAWEAELAARAGVAVAVDDAELAELRTAFAARGAMVDAAEADARDWRAIAEQHTARIDAERAEHARQLAAKDAVIDAAEADARDLHRQLAEAQAELARVEAERDALQAEADFLQAARGRTAQRLGSARAASKVTRARLATFEAACGELAATRDRLVPLVDRLQRENARLGKLAPLAGIQWSGGHAGAIVAAKAPTRAPGPPARLIVAHGRRVAG